MCCLTAGLAHQEQPLTVLGHAAGAPGPTLPSSVGSPCSRGLQRVLLAGEPRWQGWHLVSQEVLRGAAQGALRPGVQKERSLFHADSRGSALPGPALEREEHLPRRLAVLRPARPPSCGLLLSP